MDTHGKHTDRYRSIDSCRKQHGLLKMSLGFGMCRECTLPWVQGRMCRTIAKHRKADA